MKSNNPRFSFYFHLLKLLLNRRLNQKVILRLREIQSDNPDAISLPHSIMERIHAVHAYRFDKLEEGRLTEQAAVDQVELAKALFRDLAGQMRNPRVRRLHLEFKQAMGLDQDLFIQLRRIKGLGEGFGAFTLFTDNQLQAHELFQDPRFFSEMEKGDGYFHFSESSELLKSK